MEWLPCNVALPTLRTPVLGEAKGRRCRERRRRRRGGEGIRRAGLAVLFGKRRRTVPAVSKSQLPPIQGDCEVVLWALLLPSLPPSSLLPPPSLLPPSSLPSSIVSDTNQNIADSFTTKLISSIKMVFRTNMRRGNPTNSHVVVKCWYCMST